MVVRGLPRFGEALAAVRSEHAVHHRREAKRFLQEAMRTSNKMDEGARANNLWIKGADLKPVLNFLSGSASS